MLQVIFSRRDYNPGSALIRLGTWSDWSHVEAVIDNETLIGAAWPHGVAPVKMADRLSLASHAGIMTFPCNRAAALAWANGQQGKPYDLAGAIGIGLHRDWQRDDAWFCSEFIAAMLRAGGCEPYAAAIMRRITPQDLWKLNYPRQSLK